MGRLRISPAVFASVFAATEVAHRVGDYVLQRHSDACAKGEHGAVGWRACTSHVASYQATQTAAVLGIAALTGVRLRPAAVLAGAALSAATHWWIDRREPLRKAAYAVGKQEWYDFGSPREGHDDNRCLGTGAHALDQALHGLCNGLAAVVVSVGARSAD